MENLPAEAGPVSYTHLDVYKRQTYLYAFKRCVKDAKVEAVMGAYNRVNGEPACGSRTLLKDILLSLIHISADLSGISQVYSTTTSERQQIKSTTDFSMAGM